MPFLASYSPCFSISSLCSYFCSRNDSGFNSSLTLHIVNGEPLNPLPMKSKNPTLNDLQQQIALVEAQVQSLEKEIQSEWHSYTTRIRSLANTAKRITSKKWKWLLFIALSVLVLYLLLLLKERKPSSSNTIRKSPIKPFLTWLFKTFLLPLLLSSFKNILTSYFSRK